MDGEFICEEFAYQTKGIGGGNFLILGEHIESVLSAAELAVSKINQIKNVILHFQVVLLDQDQRLVQNIKV